MRKFDLIIIGGGAAGTAAAIQAEELGATTAFIEPEMFGGTAVNLGCISTKVLLHGAETEHSSEGPVSAAAADRFGFRAAMDRVERAMDTLRLHNYEWPLSSLKKMTHMRGTARFVGPNEVLVGEEVIRSDKFVIATGSVPVVPDIPGLDDIDYLTSRDLLRLERAPESMVVMGGGPLGLEFAQIFAHFGTRVTVVQRGSRLLPEMEPEAAEMVRSSLELDGINIRTQESITEIRWRGTRKEVIGKVEAGTTRYLCEEVLPAVGRAPNTGRLDLESIGVEMDVHGAIVVDDELVTSLPHIYAAGDVLGGIMVESAADAEGAIAALNALSPRGKSVDREATPWCIFVHPQAAQVGMTEADAVRRRHAVDARAMSFENLPAAVIAGNTRGLIKMIADKQTRRILGCCVVGENAGDIIHEAALAVQHRLTVDGLTDIFHVYPTYSQAVGLVAGLFRAAPAEDAKVRRLGSRAA